MTTRSKAQVTVSACDTTPELIWRSGPAREFATFRSASADEFNAAVEGWLPGYTRWTNAA